MTANQKRNGTQTPLKTHKSSLPPARHPEHVLKLHFMSWTHTATRTPAQKALNLWRGWMPSRDAGKPEKQAEGKGYEGGSRMAQPEPVTTATTELSGAPSLPGLGPMEPARRLRGRSLQGINHEVLCPWLPTDDLWGSYSPRDAPERDEGVSLFPPPLGPLPGLER